MQTSPFLRSTTFAAAAALLTACGSSNTTGHTGGAGGTGTTGDTSSASSSGGAGDTGGTSDPGGFDPGSPHTPATGCHEGFVACGDVCAHLADDSAHCGSCDTPCIFGEGCVNSTCAAGQGCAKITCGGVCIDPYHNADHCGSCDNRCADTQLCVGEVCAPGDGDGTSCAKPLIWDVEAEEHAGFRFTPGATVTHTFSCGPLAAIPTRWFRFTAPKDNTNVSVNSDGADDYILEVFSAPACDAAVLVGCNDNDGSSQDPWLKLSNTAGAVLYVAVGLKGKWSGEPADIRVDH